jgi:hypothetical protein
MKILLIILLITTTFGYTVPIPTQPLSAFRGTEHEIVVRLETPTGAPVTDATLYLFHEVDNILLDTALTNSSGHATFLWLIPCAHDLGITYLNATFLGDPERYLLPSFLSIPITIYSQMQMEIEITDNNGAPIAAPFHLHQNLVLTVFLKDENATPLTGITVHFLNEKDELISEGLTSENGSVTFACQINASLYSNVVFKVRSLSQGLFNACEELLNFSIEHTTTRFTNLPSFLQVNNQCHLAGRLRHKYGSGITGARISLLLEDHSEISDGYTDQEGYFIFNLTQYRNQLASSHFIVVNFEGNEIFQPAQAIVGLVPASTPTPFTQNVGMVSTASLTLLSFQLQIVVFSCLALGSTIAIVRIRRTTQNIVSH